MMWEINGVDVIAGIVKEPPFLKCNLSQMRTKQGEVVSRKRVE